MQNNIFNKINIATKLLVLIFIILSIIIAKSVYFLIVSLIFLCILLLLSNKSVKYYINFINSLKFWLLFIFIAYIIVTRDIVYSFICLYKVLLIILFIKQFGLNKNFQKLSRGIKTLLKPLNKLINIDNISYNATLLFYYIDIYIYSKQKIFINYENKKRIIYNFSLKYNVLARLFYTTKKIGKIESSLKLKHYKNNYEKWNIESKIFLSISVILFVIVVFKEVIL